MTKLFNETFNCERKMQNDENVLRSLNEQHTCSLHIFTYNLHHVSMTVLQFIMSRDWETIKNVVPGNSSSKPDQLCSEGKGAELLLNI